MSAVPRSSGGIFKLPNVVFLVFEAATAMFRAGSTGCVVAALEDDRVRHDAAPLVVGTLRKNAAEAASFEGNFPPFVGSRRRISSAAESGRASLVGCHYFDQLNCDVKR